MLPFDFNAAKNSARKIETTPISDLAVEEVADWLKAHSDPERRFGQIFRQAIDEVLDGQRTGRFDIHSVEVESTEKTYLGTKVEIITRAAFQLKRGKRMDYNVAGHDVDAKFTIRKAWTIPSEALGHVCLLLTANDLLSTFSVGLLRIEERYLNAGRNRDQKRTLSQEGREAIRWLVQDGPLPTNTLLHTAPETIAKIMQSGSGQMRTNELFRRLTGRTINRNTVLTVAQQDDSPKRVRDARTHLAKEGIIILGHQNAHPKIASALGLDVPVKGSWISASLTPVEGDSKRRKAEIDGSWFSLAERGEVRIPLSPRY